MLVYIIYLFDIGRYNFVGFSSLLK